MARNEAFDGVKFRGCGRTTCGKCRSVVHRQINVFVAVSQEELATLREAAKGSEEIRRVVARIDAAATRCKDNGLLPDQMGAKGR